MNFTDITTAEAEYLSAGSPATRAFRTHMLGSMRSLNMSEEDIESLITGKPLTYPGQYLILPETADSVRSYYNSLTAFLLALGIPDTEIQRLTEMYNIGSEPLRTLPGAEGTTANAASPAILWRCALDGTPLNGDVITFDTDGNTLARKRIYSTTAFLADNNFGEAFFGGQLLIERGRRKTAIVQQEVTALLLSLLIPDTLFIATGEHNLTPALLNQLHGTQAILCPDDLALEAWQQAAAGNHALTVSPFLARKGPGMSEQLKREVKRKFRSNVGDVP